MGGPLSQKRGRAEPTGHLQPAPSKKRRTRAPGKENLVAAPALAKTRASVKRAEPDKRTRLRKFAPPPNIHASTQNQPDFGGTPHPFPSSPFNFSHVEVPSGSWAARFIRRENETRLAQQTGSCSVNASSPPIRDGSVETEKEANHTPSVMKGPPILPLLSSLDTEPCSGECRVLTFFGMFIAHGMIICGLHEGLLKVIPLSFFARHILPNRMSGHYFKVPCLRDLQDRKDALTRDQVAEKLAQHVSQCCSIVLTQSTEDVISNLHIDDPIVPTPNPCLDTQIKRATPTDEVKLRYNCTSRMCDHWAPTGTKRGSNPASELIRHVKKCKAATVADRKAAMQKSLKLAPRPQYVQRLSVFSPSAVRHRSHRLLILPIGWKPGQQETADQPVSRPLLTQPSSKTVAARISWVEKTSWPKLRSQLGKFSVGTLKGLIQLPSPALIAAREGAALSVEKGLLAIKQCSGRYLAEANSFLAGQALNVQVVLGQEYE
ncbi:hypothetical protein HGRIS_003246 [Hohenbuehelia grisea]|uniref:Uncharacterized protein n=1 Tax=Hohenbuehelia grisea TaxID=104357 RepID=A0ABR3JMV4_9AGAR